MLWFLYFVLLIPGPCSTYRKDLCRDVGLKPWRPDTSVQYYGQLETVEGEAPPADDKCYSFSIGRPEKRELYSPMYPGLYPNHTDCIRIIEAPIGNTLKLDFRDKFSLEPSDGCRHDYLEVRDGGHGYDKLIGKYCGDVYPPVIESSTRWLWLRFKSDENIECSGFKAIWEEIPIPETQTEPPESRCTKERGGDEGFINSTDIDQSFIDSAEIYGKLECMWIISVPKGWKIHLQFHKFSLAVPNDCDANFVDIFNENTDLNSRVHNFCGSIAEAVWSTSNVLQVRFVALKSGFSSEFVAFYTAFRDRGKKDDKTECEADEFDCEDATCISIKLRCNKRVNCRFPTDEEKCEVKPSILSTMVETEHLLIILIVFFLILTGMCCAFLYTCFTKLIRDHKIIQEQMRASREVGLDSPNLWQTRADSPQTRESECQTRESVFSELGSLGPCSVDSTKSAPDVIIR